MAGEISPNIMFCEFGRSMSANACKCMLVGLDGRSRHAGTRRDRKIRGGKTEKARAEHFCKYMIA